MSKVTEGFKDFYNGNVTNPYAADTNSYRDWERGFNSAYFKNLEKVKDIEQKTGRGS